MLIVYEKIENGVAKKYRITNASMDQLKKVYEEKDLIRVSSFGK